MYKKFEVLPHMADYRLKISGGTKEEIFVNAALAMSFAQRKDAELLLQKECERKEIVRIESGDSESLLIDFLNEILARTQINRSIYPKVKILNFSNDSIEAEICGYDVEYFDEDLKAATYQGLDIKQIDIIWQTELVFDV